HGRTVFYDQCAVLFQAEPCDFGPERVPAERGPVLGCAVHDNVSVPIEFVLGLLPERRILLVRRNSVLAVAAEMDNGIVIDCVMCGVPGPVCSLSPILVYDADSIAEARGYLDDVSVDLHITAVLDENL